MDIVIHNCTYRIVFVDADDDRLLMPDELYHSGVTDFKTKEIYINKNLNNDSFKYTIQHELVHAMMDTYGFLQVEWTDEIVADFMAIYVEDYCKLLKEINDSKKELLNG